jgi:hypothetical protein
MYYIVHFILEAAKSCLEVATMNPSHLTCVSSLIARPLFPFFKSLFSGVYSKHAASSAQLSAIQQNNILHLCACIFQYEISQK